MELVDLTEPGIVDYVREALAVCKPDRIDHGVTA
jgi:adenosine deaminase